MRQLMLKLWKDDCGALIATEWVFVATILVLGSITGLVAVRQAVITELEEFASAVLALSQSYSFSGQVNCQSSTAGSSFQDACASIPITSVVAEGCGTAPGDPCD
jgi:hypothetical protein